jgi:hypothetical protein
MPQACNRGVKPHLATPRANPPLNENWRIARPLHEETATNFVVNCSSAGWPHVLFTGLPAYAHELARFHLSHHVPAK